MSSSWWEISFILKRCWTLAGQRCWQRPCWPCGRNTLVYLHVLNIYHLLLMSPAFSCGPAVRRDKRETSLLSIRKENPRPSPFARITSSIWPITAGQVLLSFSGFVALTTPRWPFSQLAPLCIPTHRFGGMQMQGDTELEFLGVSAALSRWVAHRFKVIINWAGKFGV